MASLQLFIHRMHYLDRPSPFGQTSRRRRYSSSASTNTQQQLADSNNNVLLSPIVNPLQKRRKVMAFIYSKHSAQPENPNQSQLAVHVYEGFDIKMRNERPVPVSIEKFLSFRHFSCGGGGGGGSHGEESVVISGVYSTPRMVPVSCASTAWLNVDTETGTETVVYRTAVQFRRRYSTVVRHAIDEELQEVDREAPKYVSHACWIVSDSL